jgi:hypothetical protein
VRSQMPADWQSAKEQTGCLRYLDTVAPLATDFLNLL